MYIVLETHGGPSSSYILSDRDGKNRVFNTYALAEEAKNACKAGMIVPIPT